MSTLDLFSSAGVHIPAAPRRRHPRHPRHARDLLAAVEGHYVHECTVSRAVQEARRNRARARLRARSVRQEVLAL